MDINTIFDGWGTELLSILIGLILVGTGCHYYKNGKIKQKQKAGNNATQKQEVLKEKKWAKSKMLETMRRKHK